MYDIEPVKTKINEAHAWLEKEYSQMHTGQASPALLDSIKIDSYGAMQPIKNVASIAVEDAKTLLVSPWDKGLLSAIEKGIQQADLNPLKKAEWDKKAPNIKCLYNLNNIDKRSINRMDVFNHTQIPIAEHLIDMRKHQIN